MICGSCSVCRVRSGRRQDHGVVHLDGEDLEVEEMVQDQQVEL